jgi:hypothetical protein
LRLAQVVTILSQTFGPFEAKEYLYGYGEERVLQYVVGLHSAFGCGAMGKSTSIAATLLMMVSSFAVIAPFLSSETKAY